MNWIVPREWSGETVFILGGGPSLTPDVVSRLEGQRVVAVNNAYVLAPRADVLFWGDLTWWSWNQHDLHRHTGQYKVTNRATPKTPGFDVLELERARDVALSLDPRKIAGSNSGMAALNLAVLFGASRIVLCGFDMKLVDGRDNFHDLHQRTAPPPPERYASKFIPEFERAVPFLDALGVETLNATPDSAMKCFPFVSLEKIVAGALAC